MGDGFVKIYESILDSSVWDQPHHVLRLWLTMLVMADADGMVSATRRALARRGTLTMTELEEALAVLTSPDPDDSSGVEDGVRVVDEGGNTWRLVNHQAYRDRRTERQVKMAEHSRNYRKRKKKSSQQPSSSVFPETDDASSPSSERHQRHHATSVEAEADPPLSPPKGEQLKLDAPAEEPKRKPRRKPRTTMPATWLPSEANRDLAAKCNLHLAHEVERFKAWTSAGDYRYANWQQAFRNHLLGQAERKGTAPANDTEENIIDRSELDRLFPPRAS